MEIGGEIAGEVMETEEEMEFAGEKAEEIETVQGVDVADRELRTAEEDRENERYDMLLFSCSPSNWSFSILTYDTS